MPLIHNQTTLPLEAGKSLFDYADDLAVRVPTSCNRNGECHECIVEVRRGMEALEPLNDTEDFLRDNYRLACQARVIDIEADIEFNILRRQPRILTESIQRDDIDLDPLTVREGDNIIFKGHTSPIREQLPFPRSAGEVPKAMGAPSEAIFAGDARGSVVDARGTENERTAPFAKRKGARKSEAIFAGDARGGPRVVDRYRGRILGIAADIGTTTVAMNLVDLETGDILYTASFENPQRFGGSDVMNRISYDTGTYRGELQAVLISSINYEIGEMVRALKIRRRHIVELVAVGNTTMRDILFGIDVEPIGQKPYKSHIEDDFRNGNRDTTALNRQAHELGIRINPNANIYSGPIIASHIGSDIAADLLTIAIDQQDDPVLLIDIGTNTEIIAGNKNQLHAASCPAGPAFEGGNVTYAMPGYNGAVERVVIPSPSQSEGDAASGATTQGVPGEGSGTHHSREGGNPEGKGRVSPVDGGNVRRTKGESPLSHGERGASKRSDASGVCPGRTGGGNTPNDHQQNPANHTNQRNPRFRQPLLTTIGHTTPIGICGSGLIDLLAELRRHNIMNELGNFNDGSDEFTFHHENRLTLSRADISALAQAKAANYCGQNIVLETTGTSPTDYTRLYLAGGFANYINIQNAINIGFIPDIPHDRITKIGNASLQGATIMLTNATKRAAIEQLATTITHIELETNPNFFDHFVEGCQFKK